jgi:uroporphyrinogen-III synthase
VSGLRGRRIVVTRASHQARDLEDRLRDGGAVALPYPCIEIVPPEDQTALDEALRDMQAGAFDWLILTSSNTVRALEQRLNALEIGALRRLRVAAVGSQTAQAAHQRLNLEASVIPEEFTSEALARTLQALNAARVFLPHSALAESDLTAHLTQIGAVVREVDAYRTVIGSGGVDLVARLAAHEVDAITFTSPSTVTYFLQRLAAEGGGTDLLEGLCMACIGPKTTAVARQNHLPNTLTAANHTLEGLVTALEDYFAKVTIQNGR